LNRIIQIGEYTGSFASADSTTHGSASLDFPTSGPDSAKTINIYDKNTTGDVALSSARNLLGRLFSVQTITGGLRDTCYYSYDSLGRVEWQIHRMAGLGAKKIAYEYDLQGNITKLSYIDPLNTSNNTLYFYEYDSAGRLARVYSDESSSGVNKVKEAEYSYLASGKAKRFQAGVAQGMDYQYNERDWLTNINNTSLSPQADSGHDGINGITATDRFAMRIGYYNLAEIGSAQDTTPQYNGNISWIVYNMSGVTYTGAHGRTSLVGTTYKYDHANRLTGADFGYNRDSLWRTTPAYDEHDWSYDKIGNILGVQRWGAGCDTVPPVVALTSRDSIASVSIGADSIRLSTSYVVPAGAIDDYAATTEIRLKPGYVAQTGSYVIAAISQPLVTKRMDSFTYNYSSGNSHLTSIADIVSANTYTTDLDNQPANNYSYDGNGNMISDLQNGIDSIIYDYRNLPLKLKRNGVWTTMRYDADGNRTFKSTPGGQTLYYLPDASGRTLAVLNSDGSIRMLNVYGLDNIGYMSVSYQPSRVNTRYYYLKDHLGTIKMTVNAGGTVTSYDDFYPFGMTMEGRSGNFGKSDARFKFSGKERDVESGYDYFGARYYDARIGRFLSIDPHSRRYPALSPFNYAINNPLAYLDPNGLDSASSQTKNSKPPDKSNTILLVLPELAIDALDVSVGLFAWMALNLSGDQPPQAQQDADAEATSQGTGITQEQIEQIEKRAEQQAKKEAEAKSKIRSEGRESDASRVAKEEGFTKEQQGKFKELIEKTKRAEGRGGKGNLPYDRLKELAKEIKK
jgi:RHS repeat-associated protein